MKIGLVVDRFDPLAGGAEYWTWQHAVELTNRGHEVHVITGYASPQAQQASFCVHTYEPKKSWLARAAAAHAVVRRLNLDIVHDRGVGWHSHIVHSKDGSQIAQWKHRLEATSRWTAPWKGAFLQTLPSYQQRRALLTRQLSDPDRIVIAASQMCANNFQHYHDVPDERLRVVYHGADVIRFSPDRRLRYRDSLRRRWGIGQEEVVFLFVGHDQLRKGLRTAKQAVRRLASAGNPVRLMVVGDPQSAVQSPAPQTSQEVILYAGRVNDTVPYYAAADAFVLPTFYDPCSLSLGEASASGLPVVTTRTNGASELLTDGQNGFVLEDAADDMALTDRLEKLLEPSLRLTMGIAARRLAVQYPLERNCDEIVQIYEKIALLQTADATLPLPTQRYSQTA